LVEQAEVDTNQQVTGEAEPEGDLQPEVLTPTGPTVEELKTQLTALEGKYTKEVADKDRGNARLAKEIDTLKRAIQPLARRTFGEEDEPVETEYQRWQRELAAGDKADSPQPTQQVTQAQRDTTIRLQTLADEYGVDYANPPVELSGVIDELANLYYSDKPDGAVKVWKAGLAKMRTDKQTTADKEAKAKQADAERKAEQGQRDTTPSTGGGASSYEGIRDAWMKNPNDPGAYAAYVEARRARGI